MRLSDVLAKVLLWAWAFWEGLPMYYIRRKMLPHETHEACETYERYLGTKARRMPSVSLPGISNWGLSTSQFEGKGHWTNFLSSSLQVCTLDSGLGAADKFFSGSDGTRIHEPSIGRISPDSISSWAFESEEVWRAVSICAFDTGSSLWASRKALCLLLLMPARR